MLSPTANEALEIGIDIGRLPIAVQTDDPEFIRILERRFARFQCNPAGAVARLEVTVTESPLSKGGDDELKVERAGALWTMRRGDFAAQWNPTERRGRVRSLPFHYALDSVLRIVHSLELAESGEGFLLHSASAIRNGRAFLFSGVSGAGKTTISRLAPADATLLSDEISYVRLLGGRYYAFGTPFAGDLGVSGENVMAPLQTIYFLSKGDQNRIKPVSPAAAVSTLLRNVLFFADDERLVAKVFQTACEFVSRVPVLELTFRPDVEVWNLIQ
jgi:hypothetical protein